MKTTSKIVRNQVHYAPDAVTSRGIFRFAERLSDALFRSQFRNALDAPEQEAAHEEQQRRDAEDDFRCGLHGSVFSHSAIRMPPHRAFHLFIFSLPQSLPGKDSFLSTMILAGRFAISVAVTNTVRVTRAIFVKSILDTSSERR